MSNGNRLTEVIVDEVIEYTNNNLKNLGEAYKKGFATKEEFYRNSRILYWEELHKVLSRNGVVLKIKPDNYGDFVRDYQSYINNEELTENISIPWLFSGSNLDEASTEERKQFIRLIDSFHQTPEYYEPVPKGIKVPQRDVDMPGTLYPKVRVIFDCMEDNSLINETEPVGKTFRFVNSDGLETVLYIKEDLRNKTLNYDFGASGSIEGYTALDGQLHISVKCATKKTIWLYYIEREEDAKAISEFPIWKEYLSWRTKKNEETNKMFQDIDRYFEQFLE